MALPLVAGAARLAQLAKKAYDANKALKKAQKAQKAAEKAQKASAKAKDKPIEKVGSKAEQSVQKMNAKKTADRSVKSPEKTAKDKLMRDDSKVTSPDEAGNLLARMNRADRQKALQSPKTRADRTKRELKSVQARRKREDKTSSGTKYKVE